MDEQDAVWSETTDGDLLKQLFGYYPTLHDARISDVEIIADERRVEILVDYADQVGHESSASDLKVRIKLIWKGVQQAKWAVSESYLSGLSFRHVGDLIRTDFELGFGTGGFLLSEQFEALLERADPPPDLESPDVVWLSLR